MRPRLKALAGGLEHALVRPIAEADTIDLVTRLTLVLMLLSTWVVGSEWQFMTPLRLAALAGLLVPGLHRNKTLWALLAGTMALKTAFLWWSQDNHLFLLTWWLLALALALRVRDPLDSLRTSGRLLIGLSFAFAVLWKGLLSPDYPSGAYFHYTFLTDGRFRDLAILLGGMPQELIGANLRATAELSRLDEAGGSVRLQDVPQLVVLTRLVTGWTLAIEAAAALAFLWPEGRGPSKARHAILLVFACTTYLAAPVSTFGWTLLTIGLAQCEPELRRTRLAYVAGCGLVLVYNYVPIVSLLRRLLGQ